MSNLAGCNTNSGEGESEDLFTAIAANIYAKGYSIHPNALPSDLANQLLAHVQAMSSERFSKAGIGREGDLMVNHFVRTDEVSWINGETEAGIAWLAWASELQCFLNRKLLLGLFSFESHFAHYGKGDFYKTHKDAFKGEANRVLTVVVYLNTDWLPGDGGELVVYTDETLQQSIKVTPGFGTVVVFLSEEFPHEVLPANRDRFSIAGWFRVNCSRSERVDPPR